MVPAAAAARSDPMKAMMRKNRVLARYEEVLDPSCIELLELKGPRVEAGEDGRKSGARSSDTEVEAMAMAMASWKLAVGSWKSGFVCCVRSLGVNTASSEGLRLLIERGGRSLDFIAQVASACLQGRFKCACSGKQVFMWSL